MSALEKFDEFGDLDYGREDFDSIHNKLSDREDLHAFLLLDSIFPSDKYIISAARHDQIWLCFTEEQLDTLKSSEILELVKCGVFIDEGALSMFI